MLMRQRAYSLPLVLVIVALLSAGLTVLLTTVLTSSTTTMRLFRRTQAGYAITGVARAGAVAAGDALLLRAPLPDPLPTDPAARAVAVAAHLAAQRDEVNGELTALVPELTPAGFVVDELRIDALRERSNGQIQEGAFRGMNALIQPFDVTVRGHHQEMGSGAYIRVDASVERLFIPMFQFFAFIDGYAFVFNGPGAKYAGRIHSNGNMCLGSGQNSFFEKITSGGKIYKLRGSGCRGELSGGIGSRTIFVSRSRLTEGAATYFTPGFETGFSLLHDKDADSPDWLTHVALWGGQVGDSTHGVPVLKAPIRGTPLVQQGRNAVHALVSNTTNSRFLIDPVLPDEPIDVRAQKVAFKADIRILDGVWYIRNPNFPEELGTPIWSDHPGRVATDRAERRWLGLQQNVGQEDLFGNLARPTKYSHYRTVPNTLRFDNVTGGTAVVSYGVLHRMGGTPVRWVPGFQNTSPTGGCSRTVPCFPTTAADSVARLLQGTRGGFRNAWDESGVTDGAADCGANREASMGFGNFDAHALPLFNMLPLNFDVAAFQAALLDNSPNELGGRFAARGEPFNGAIWIGSAWPGFRTGYGDATSSSAAGFWPFQGQQNDARSGNGGDVVNDTSQPLDGLTPATLSTAATYAGPANASPTAAATLTNRPFQRALPQTLCTDTTPANVDDGVLATYGGANDFSAGTGRRFFVPRCEDYDTGALNAQVNAVRVINADTVSRTTLPFGLSIVTNMPMFVLGSLNTSSIPADRPGDSNVGWAPVMVGGDTIGLLSNAWTDAKAPWNVPVATYWLTRNAASTRYHGAFLYGWAEAASGPSGGCREELSYSMRLHEHWHRGAGLPLDRVVRGSIFVGWNSVYGTAFSNVHERDNESGAWHDGAGNTKIYSYDHHLDVIQNQPPAAPQFQLTNVLRQFSN
jgi:hypothetical protein